MNNSNKVGKNKRIKIQVACDMKDVQHFCLLALKHGLYKKHHLLEVWYFEIIKNICCNKNRKVDDKKSSPKIALAYDDLKGKEPTPIGICLIYNGILSVFVKKGYRRAKIGTKLIRKMRGNFPLSVKQGMYCTINRIAIKFFSKCRIKSSE